MTKTQSGTAGRRPIHDARDKTRGVREELEVASAELHLTHTILERELPAHRKVGDVRKAIDQNGAAAANVAEASEELAEVEALLAQEIEERQRLEREIAQRG